MQQRCAPLLPLTGECAEEEFQTLLLPSALITSSPGQSTELAHDSGLNPLHVLEVDVQLTRVDAPTAVERPRDLVQVNADHPHVFKQRRHNQAIIAGQDWPNARPFQIQGTEKAGDCHAGGGGSRLDRRMFVIRDTHVQSAILFRRLKKSVELPLIHLAVGPLLALATDDRGLVPRTGQAAADTADISDKVGRLIPHANLVTRITLPARALEAYRLIRPFVENLREGGYDSYLLETELMERNCYREIRNGYGTLQMLDLTDPVKKARAEVMSLVQNIEDLLSGQKEVAANG